VVKLTPYIEAWEKKKFIPEEYAFAYAPQKAGENAEAFFRKLEPGVSALDIHNLAFAAAKERNVPPAKMFEECYLALLSKPRGPKLGKLVEAIGIEKVKKDVL